MIEKSSTIKLSEIYRSLIGCYEAIGDLKKFIAADIKFHQSIVAVVENPILIDTQPAPASKFIETKGNE